MYRLAEVFGQSHATRLALRLLARRRLPQALLIAGVPGCGRRTWGRSLAAALLCRTPGADSDACGTCDGCRMVAAGSHPDLVESSPDSAGVPSVEWVRDEVASRVSESPLVAERRVFLLHGVERYAGTSIACANALLKVLEEPPAGVHLLLTCSNAAAVLTTIRSRAQLVRLDPLANPDLIQVLMRQGWSRDEARVAAADAHGSHRGCVRGSPPPPLSELVRLADQGLSMATVAAILDRLPAGAEGGEQRRILRAWLLAAAMSLRPALRKEPERAQRAMHAVGRLQLAAGDLARNLMPRSVLEGLGASVEAR